MLSSHSMSYSQSDSPSALTYFTHSYSYDANGNISSLSKLADGQTSVLSYQYDGLDQLIRVNDQEANKTVLYSYDAGGNITSAKTYPYSPGELSGSPLSEKSYSYASSGWKDLLINFNGDDILYDEIGNPLQYRDGMAFAWQYGRRLASVSQGSNAYSYSYDASGVRLAKTINGSSYNYIYDNGSLLYADTPLGGMTFIYDNDSVIGYKYNSAYYFYLKNLQGDILGAVDASGNLLYQYRYDAWGVPTVLDAQGNPISPDSAHIANANPLRYRGYFFDSETGFYYLLSRYYDPETGRFINADEQFSIGGDLTGLNMFAYCDNNPISRSDQSGNAWSDVVDFFSRAVNEIGKAFSSLSLAYAGCGGAALADGPLPVGDIAGAIGAAALSIGAIGIGIYQAIQAPAKAIPKTEEKEKDLTLPPKKGGVIYRYGGTNPGNLTPSQRDVDLFPITGKGLSFSTIPKPGAAMTTIEALNATGVVYAIQDGPTHVSVYPVGGTLEDWHNAGSSSIWTTTVKSVVIKWS